MAAAARIGDTSRVEGPLWQPTVTGDTVEPLAQVIAEAVLKTALVLGVTAAA